MLFRIKSGLSGAALKFYKREFEFFKKVTGISGIIRYTVVNCAVWCNLLCICVLHCIVGHFQSSSVRRSA